MDYAVHDGLNRLTETETGPLAQDKKSKSPEIIKG